MKFLKSSPQYKNQNPSLSPPKNSTRTSSLPNPDRTKLKDLDFSDLFASRSASDDFNFNFNLQEKVQFIPTFSISYDTKINNKLIINRDISIKSKKNVYRINGESGELGGESMTPMDAIQMMAQKAMQSDPGSIETICYAAQIAAVRTGSPQGFAAIQALALQAVSPEVIITNRVM